MTRFKDVASSIASKVQTLEARKLLDLRHTLGSADREFYRFSRRFAQFYKNCRSRTISDRLAERADELSQAILQTDNLASLSATKVAGLAGGSLSTSLGFGIASVFGTAGTGAAIGSLSGAAATSASLAWLGGSVASGGLLLLVTGLAAGVGSAYLARKCVVEKWISKSRRATGLSSREHKSIEALGVLSDYMRNRSSLSNLSALELSLLRKTTNVLQSDLSSVIAGYENWQKIPKQRVYKAFALFKSTISELIGDACEHQIDIAVGSFSASLVAFLSNPQSVPNIESDEYLIVEAVRLSKSSLMQASDEDVINYIASLDDDQMGGLISSIKGKYFELLFVKHESSDGDNVTASLFESTNHQASDIQLIDVETGEVLDEIQLKATDYLSYIREHQKKYEDVPIHATSEVARKDDSIIDTGISNESLTKDVEQVFAAVRGGDEPLNNIIDSVALSMTVGCALEIRRIVNGAPVDRSFRQSLIRQGASAALVSAVLSAT